MLRNLLLILFCLVMGPAQAAVALPTLPPQAYDKLPILKEELKVHWPDLLYPSMIAAQVETESCISLKHKRCWNTRAELKTDREYGFGLGQITITKRFNVFEESKASDKSLADWQWENRFDPRYQLRAIAIKDRNTYRLLKWAPLQWERLAMTFSAYNGGTGAVLKDRTLCTKTPGCDATKWYGHIELNSYKSKVAVKGYGKSFYEINREYPRQIMFDKPRRAKYVPYMGA